MRGPQRYPAASRSPREGSRDDACRRQVGPLTRTAWSLTLWLFMLIPLVGGCAWTDKTGVRHVVVIGLGVVSRGQTNGVAVSDVRATGLVLDHGFSAGWVHRHRVEIDPNWASNVVINIKTTPFGLTVKHFELGLTNLHKPLTLQERNPTPCALTPGP